MVDKPVVGVDVAKDWLDVCVAGVAERIDAQLILAFVCHRLAQRGLRLAIPGDPALMALAARRRQLVDSLHAERCRLAIASLDALRHSHHAVTQALRDSLEAIEAELATTIAGNPHTAKLAGLLQTVFGIGPVVAVALIADLPELGRLSAQTDRRPRRPGAAHQP